MASYHTHVVLSEYFLKKNKDIKRAIDYATFYGLPRKCKELSGPEVRGLKDTIGRYASKLSATPDKLLSLEDKNALERQFKLYIMHAPCLARMLLQNSKFQKDLLEILERWSANSDFMVKYIMIGSYRLILALLLF